MSYTTLGKALRFLERPSGKTIAQNRAELVELANRIRNERYMLYHRLDLEVNAEECFLLQEFCNKCDPCGGSYLGFTLPAHMETAEAAWLADIPLKIFSRWREYHTGVQQTESCRLSLIEVQGTYCTELDLPANKGVTVGFKCLLESDIDKEVRVKVETGAGEKLLKVKLTNQGWVNLGYEIKEITHVILPLDLLGGVEVAYDSGGSWKIISQYQPTEHVPSYKRMKITGVCKSNCKKDMPIYVVGLRRFVELCYDDDIVEFDSMRTWEEAALYFKHHDNGTDRDLLQKAQYHFMKFQDLILGEIAREHGKNRQDKINFTSSQPRRSRLVTKRRNHRSRWYR